MKKAFKKIMTVALVLALVFSFIVKPKKADASIAALTAAGIAAAASIPLSTVLLGMGGLAAVGAAIYYQDDIISVGQKMAGEIALKGLLTSDYVNESTGAVTLNGALVDAAASGVKSLPAIRTTTITDNYSMHINSDNDQFYSLGNSFLVPVITTDTALVRFTILTTQYPQFADHADWTTLNGKYYLKIQDMALNNIYYQLVTPVGSAASYKLVLDVSIPKSLSGQNLKISLQLAQNYTLQWTDSVSIQNLTTPTVVEEPNETVVNAPTTINDMQSFAYTNNVTNNTMMIDPAADMTGATVGDLYQSSYDNLNESILQTGILTKIWNGITSIPSSIAAAATNAATAINTKAQDLWDDAGAIWSGMGDTLTNIQTDVNTNIGALADSMAGGIDNIRTDIGAMMDNLRAGIDSVATSAAANMAAWGQLTLDGIDAAVGTISTGLTSIWERVGAIPGAIAAIPGDIVTGLTELAIPTAAQTAENEENMQATKQLFLSKFEFITVPIEQIKSLYAQRKSLHDLTVDIMGQTVYVLPIQFAGVVSGFRPVASGAAVVGTIIFIYRRIQPGDVI